MRLWLVDVIGLSICNAIDDIRVNGSVYTRMKRFISRKFDIRETVIRDHVFLCFMRFCEEYVLQKYIVRFHKSLDTMYLVYQRFETFKIFLRVCVPRKHFYFRYFYLKYVSKTSRNIYLLSSKNLKIRMSSFLFPNIWRLNYDEIACNSSSNII